MEMKKDIQTSPKHDWVMIGDGSKPLTKTLIIMIIDESDSMGPKKSDVIGGFNQFLSDQRKVKGDSARLILVKFNTVSTVVHFAIAIDSVPELSKSNYSPGGGTALFDAVADGIRIAEKQQEPSEQVLCVIMTDGEENSSRETTHEQCAKIIAGKEETKTWTFVYIGENPERWAKEMGFSKGNVREEDVRSCRGNFDDISKATTQHRKKGGGLSKIYMHMLFNCMKIKVKI